MLQSILHCTGQSSSHQEDIAWSCVVSGWALSLFVLCWNIVLHLALEGSQRVNQSAAQLTVLRQLSRSRNCHPALGHTRTEVVTVTRPHMLL